MSALKFVAVVFAASLLSGCAVAEPGTGIGAVVLKEDSDIYEGCGGAGVYQMPLPSKHDSYTFTITAKPGTTWHFSGSFTDPSK